MAEYLKNMKESFILSINLLCVIIEIDSLLFDA